LQGFKPEVSDAEVIAAAALLGKIGQLIARDRKSPMETVKQTAVRKDKKESPTGGPAHEEVQSSRRD